MELQLFRVKVFGPTRRSLFDPAFEPTEVLRDSLLQRPTSPPRRGVSWHIGNVESLDDTGYYFRIGRQSRATLPQLDPATGNFMESEFESAPYTHALMDVSAELCAIAPKFTLASNAEAIARRLIDVLSHSDVSQLARLTFAVGPLSNPDAFLSYLRAAHAIRSFTFSFRRRNPFDANELFVQPFERLVEETDGHSGQATVKGNALNEEALEQITRSVAATGDDARARLVLDPEAKPVVRTLRGTNVAIPADDLEADEEKRDALNAARREYQRIRGRDGQ